MSTRAPQMDTHSRRLPRGDTDKVKDWPPEDGEGTEGGGVGQVRK